MSIARVYHNTVLKRPLTTLLTVTLAAACAAWFAKDFGLDASADSLTLERDADLQYYRSIRARYGSDDFLIVTFSPNGDLFDDANLREITRLRDQLAAIPDVASVVSILDAPLVASPPTTLRHIDRGIKSLEDPDTDRSLAREELLTSPLYRSLLISPDGQTTALRVDLRQDEEYHRLRQRRDRLREKRFSATLTAVEAVELSQAAAAFEAYSRKALQREETVIAAVRSVMADHRDHATLYLGGVPMIVADSIEYIRHDLVVFGSAVLVFLIVILASAFKKLRWVALPLLTCLGTCALMVGFLGLTGWRVTVVSSNFVSLLLILCLALNLHLIVRYRELHWLHPRADQLFLVGETVKRIVVPCLYTALTTMVAFGSLLVSGIRPVIDFGWMMVIGIAVAFVLSFTFFPAALVLLEPGKPSARRDVTAAITAFFARLIHRRSGLVLSLSTVVVLVSLVGTTRLTVENRFIDYYKRSTEIYQGMELIDQQLGGTTPLDVIVDAPTPVIETEVPVGAAANSTDHGRGYDEFDQFEDIFDEELEGEAGITARSYWLNSSRLSLVTGIHEYLDQLPETGKVISIATAAKIFQQLDPAVLEDDLYLSVVYKRLPAVVLDALFTPYLSPDGDQLRFSVRVFETDPSLRRAELLKRIRSNLIRDFGLAEEQIHLSGMVVLYNNMLQSLFRSQILTLGAVFLAIMLMFLLLFRSAKIAVAAIIPNLSAAAIVLGVMGWLNIPLDLMTITIAAITVGIAVDDTIHYIHRFRTEFMKDGDYWAAIARCHRTIGRAMYYTSLTIMLGFSILVLSRFVPTIYFGLLTGLAMVVALLANLTMLPILIRAFRAAGNQSRLA